MNISKIKGGIEISNGKYSLFALVLIIAVVATLSCVSAADSNATDIADADFDDAILQESAAEDLKSDDADLDVVGDGEINKTESKVSFSNPISYRYGESGSTYIAVEGASIRPDGVNVVGHPEAYIELANDKLSVSGLAAGSYTLNVITTPDENHTAANASLAVTVSKAAAAIKVSKLTAAYKKGTGWTIKLVDSNGKPIADTLISLKVYTGSKYKTVTVRTNSNGIATYKTSSLSVGTHKVILSLSNENYTANTVTSSIKIIKQTALKFAVKSISQKEGTTLVILVLKKGTKKFLNGVKLKLLIYTGSKYKTVNLVTGKFQGSKGVCAYATNTLSKGKHTVKIMPVALKYKGSAKSKMVIKKSAKKYPSWTVKISKGKSQVSYG